MNRIMKDDGTWVLEIKHKGQAGSWGLCLVLVRRMLRLRLETAHEL